MPLCHMTYQLMMFGIAYTPTCSFKVCSGTIDNEYNLSLIRQTAHHGSYSLSGWTSFFVEWNLASETRYRVNERIMEVLQWVVYCNTVCLPAKMAFPGCFLPVLFEFEGAAAASFLRHVGCPGGLRLRSIFNLCSLSRQHQQRHYQQLKINLVNNASSVFLESGCIYPLSLFGLVP